jgi:thiamine biosynthesis lipoprotein
VPSFLKRAIIPLLVVAVLAGVAVLRLRPSPDEMIVRRQILMGTLVEISAWGEDSGRVEAAVDEALAEMARIERLMGPGEGSDAVRLSRSVDGAAVAPETAEVIALGLHAGEVGGGAFDLTLGRLKALWGIESERPRVPVPAEIRQALAGTGPGALRREGNWIGKRDPALVIDLGGIAKGYAVDRAAEILRRGGVAGASVNAGGDIRLLGDRQGQPWRIGIQHPRDPQRLLGVLPLTEGVVVTSGDYERFFEVGGERYHHLFDPKTGLPARGCQSVTVVAPTAVWADALSTAAFVLGPERGLKLLDELPEVEGIVVAADGSRRVTSGLEGIIEWR